MMTKSRQTSSGARYSEQIGGNYVRNQAMSDGRPMTGTSNQSSDASSEAQEALAISEGNMFLKAHRIPNDYFLHRVSRWRNQVLKYMLSKFEDAPLVSF